MSELTREQLPRPLSEHDMAHLMWIVDQTYEYYDGLVEDEDYYGPQDAMYQRWQVLKRVLEVCKAYNRIRAAEGDNATNI